MAEIVNKDRIQRDDSNPLHYHSNFRDNGYKLAGTYRYGEYAPTMVLDCICDDKHRIKTSHKVKSYTMKQPLFQDINLHDDTFFVPDSAILPLNCDKLATIPNIGDDVDAKEVGTSVVGFSKKIYDFFSGWIDDISDVAATPHSRLTRCLRFLAMYDTILSTGSLLSSMGAPLIADAVAVDRIIDSCMTELEGKEFNVQFGDQVYNVGASAPHGPGEYVISLREFWQKIHDDYNFDVLQIDADSAFAGSVTFIFNKVLAIRTTPSALPIQDEEAPLDLRYFWAYQITCAHFYSNDKVDYVYSADLFRQLIGDYLSKFSSEGGGSFNDMFSVNGLYYRYDYLSAFYFNNMLNSVVEDSIFDFPAFQYVLAYLRALFGYNRSLRYVDYFTGSRTLPLAPGDTSVEVKDNGINVVDSIQKRWFIRLWSQISRVGRKRSEQMKGLFPGVENTVDWHDPIWIKASQGNVFAEEVDNTGSNQFNEQTPIAVTSSLHGGGSIALEMSVADREGILITITYFDIRRYYSHGIDRHFFYVDRFDRFQPFLQFNGDQKVYQKELNADSLFVNVFGYQGRYEEYKTRMDRAFGGFSENSVLPGMIFLADEGRDRFSIDNIGPNYIRSYPAELDKFFISLSGWSLGTYFHFMMLTDNEIDSDRPMSYNPQIQ